MTARNLLTTAFTVLGLYYLWIGAARLLGVLLTLGPLERGPLPWLTAGDLVLGILLLLLRRRLGKAFAPEPAADAEAPTGSQLQLVGITLVSVWFAASGLAALCTGGLDTVLASPTDPDFAGTTFLSRNSDAIALTAVGFVGVTSAGRLNGWLTRSPQQSGARSLR